MLLLTSWDNDDKTDFIIHELHDLLSWCINNNGFVVIFSEEDNSTIADVVTMVEDDSFDDDIDDSDDERKLFDEKNCCVFDRVVLTGIVCDTSLLILPKVGNKYIDDDIARYDNVFRCDNDNDDDTDDDDTDNKKNNFLDDAI